MPGDQQIRACFRLPVVNTYQSLKNWYSSGQMLGLNRVSAWTCWPSVSVLWLGEVATLVYISYHLAGLVVKASSLGMEDPGFESHLRQDFSRSSHTSDLIGTPVATLPGAWHYRVSAGTGRPGVSILWLGEVESLVCNFYLSVAAHKIVWADPSLKYTSMLLGC